MKKLIQKIKDREKENIKIIINIFLYIIDIIIYDINIDTSF